MPDSNRMMMMIVHEDHTHLLFVHRCKKLKFSIKETAIRREYEENLTIPGVKVVTLTPILILIWSK